MTTLFEYLVDAHAKGIIDHSLRVERVEVKDAHKPQSGFADKEEIASRTEIEFYIHPANVDGDTPSFVVKKLKKLSPSQIDADVVFSKDAGDRRVNYQTEEV